MAALRSLGPIPLLAGRRVPVAYRSTAHHPPSAFRSASTRRPDPTLFSYTLVLVLGAGVGGAGVAWWRKNPDNIQAAPDHQVNPELEALSEGIVHELLKEQPVRDVLHQMGSSSKLKFVPEIAMAGVMLEDNAPDIVLPPRIIFRIEDAEMEPGKPNVVGIFCMLESHPKFNMNETVKGLSLLADRCYYQGRLARSGRALILAVCEGNIGIGVYDRWPTKVDGGHSGRSDNSAIVEIKE